MRRMVWFGGSSKGLWISSRDKGSYPFCDRKYVIDVTNIMWVTSGMLHDLSNVTR